MKRPPQSFVVEHKRRPRRAPGEPASIWSDDVGRELRGLLTEEAAALASDAEPVGKASAGSKRKRTLAIPPQKRILESQAQASAVIEVEPATEPKVARPRGRPRKVVTQAVVQPEELPEPSDAWPVEEEMVSADEPAMSAVQPARSGRPSYRARRSAARKAMPLADRWRWNLRY